MFALFDAWRTDIEAAENGPAAFESARAADGRSSGAETPSSGSYLKLLPGEGVAQLGPALAAVAAAVVAFLPLRGGSGPLATMQGGALSEREPRGFPADDAISAR
ncbi:hypothetical protein [Halegenticoccus soli]|uniref:hypothetical protein n=1 Tax=Halegenticoccus soli TaxID=1985678 RepID=UPI000C6EA43A|nr:hypothetical protein [Halegenticoccus soli]